MEAKILNINDFKWYQHAPDCWTLTWKHSVYLRHLEDMAEYITVEGKRENRRFYKTRYGHPHCVVYWEEGSGTSVLHFKIVD